jgi:hypothetical protein
MRATLLLTVILGMGAPCAFAQTAAERAACRDDFQKLCPGVSPGGGRILGCLSKQKDKLSDACRKVVEKHSG